MRYYFLNVFLGRVVLAALADFACFAIAAAVTWITFRPPFEPLHYLAVCGAGALGSFVVLYYSDAYGLTVLGSGRRTLASVVAAMGVSSALAGLAYFVLSLPSGSLETAANVAGLYFPLLLVERLGLRLTFSRPRFTERVLVVGTSDLGRAIAKEVRLRRNLGTEIAGFLSDDLDDQGAWIEGVPVLGPVNEFRKLVEREQIDRVVVASKNRDEHFPADDLLAAKLGGLSIESGVSYFERVTGRVHLRDLRASYLIFSQGFATGRLYAWSKRAIDVAVAATLLTAVFPILALCALAIVIDSRGPALFVQQRVGRGGRPYRVFKLRSMRHDAEETTGPVFAEVDDDRVTRVGWFLRRARIDELPQLVNVLLGDMSLVGPRPERPEFADELSQHYPYFRLRQAVRPGITGWAQIRHGYVNNVDDWEDKLALDLYYLKHRSLSMDLMILWKTLQTVVLLRGV
jgi:exopolysaccharide biosynthesis polyprenyl glycosylphosphotransferase